MLFEAVNRLQYATFYSLERIHMTKKLQKKLNLIARSIAFTALGAVTLGVIWLGSFVMQKNSEYIAPSVVETNAEAEENIEIITGKDVENTQGLDEASNQEAMVLANTASDGAIICDSLVQGARDNDLPDGNYTFRVTGEINGGEISKDYPVELINFYDDVTYSLDGGQTSKTISLGDTTTEHKTLIVKYHKNLTIDEGVKVTATNVSNLTYKKGMYLCVMGELTNNGKISMTARGTYNQAGEDVYLWKDKSGNYEYVPASGASGMPAIQPYLTIGTWVNGKDGNNGTDRGTGSGGQGGLIQNGLNGATYSWMGASTGGTSYSGGNGSGGVVNTNGPANSQASVQASDNRGGNAYTYNSGAWVDWFAGGGAGIVGGNSSYYGSATSAGTDTKGQNGTGGLLVLYANSLTNEGTIESNGSNGAGANRAFGNSYGGATGGGGSRPEAQ